MFGSYKKPKWMLILVIVVALSFGLGVNYNKVIAQENIEAQFELFLQALDIVRSDYVDKDLDIKKLVYGSIRGLLSALDDPYSRFMEPKAFQEMKIRLSGSYSGIGIYIGIKDNLLTVISPIKGTPAANAGLRAGDKIVTINKKSTRDLALEEAVGLIRGKAGTKVILGIMRPKLKEPQDIAIVRGKIVIKSVEETYYDDSKIAYIKLNTFENRKAAYEMGRALREAQNWGAKGLILDLRYNGGGLLTNAVEIGSMFVKQGPIVYTVDRNGHKEIMSSTGRTIWEKPMVVLINEASASASEILAGALRDSGVAPLVGNTTFGKASVQNVKPLSDGSVILLTIAKYLTPKGDNINKVGIKPDYMVLIPTPEAEALLSAGEPDPVADLQLSKAFEVLRKKMNESM